MKGQERTAADRRLIGICFVFGVAMLAVAIASPSNVQAQRAATPDEAAFFEAKIRPILADKCYACHGPSTQLGGLRLDSATAILKGGDSGPAIAPGNPEKSLLIQAVRQTGKLKMPQGGRLRADEVANLEAWVKMGAPWPGQAKDEKAKLWSLEPVKNPPVPVIQKKKSLANSVDNFIEAKLETKHLTLSPQADKRTLIRRVTYDLTGLPPTPDEVDQFLADRNPSAYEKVVDRLLASPRYGERQARLWLDVARYADTKGYMFTEDRNYPNAYTYRDWVIGAFNEDLPYDQFIVKQLAADRLPETKRDERDLAALGFLTVGRRFLNSQPDIMDDRIDVTMRGLQGFTVACARCHDHKFDPIPTQDYYSLYAVFASSQEVSPPISGKAIDDPWERYNAQISKATADIRTLTLAQIKRLRDNKASQPADVQQALQLLGEGNVPEPTDLKKLSQAFEPSQRDALNAMEKSLLKLKQTAPTAPEFAMAMVDAHPSDGVVFKRGNPGAPGDPAPRRFLKALSKPGVEREHWTADSGRLELARAIASRDNPLTARVFVNRVWQNHFGTGLVRTASDFGHQGEPPTHPELLDYLASKFMGSGWSIKKLHRLIVTSATYGQTSSVSKAAGAVDPDNRLFSRMNRHRLDLEQMRDSFMVAAGRLDVSRIGGKSVDLWAAPFTPRRAVYGFVERQNLPGIFRTFDFASPDTTSARRFQTTVPQQALYLMNSPLSVEQAEAAASRPEIRSAIDDPQRVRRLYRTLFQRLPAMQELTAGLAYLNRGLAVGKNTPSRLALYTQALMMTNEFLFVD